MPTGERAASTRRLTVKTAGLALAAILIVVAAAYAGYKRTAASDVSSAVPTATVTRGDVQSSVPADGRAVVDEWELNFGAAGRVSSVDVSEGETVTAGQVLATLDDVKASAQVAQARTAVASARSKLESLKDQPIAEEVAAKQALVDSAESALHRAEEAYALLKAESAESTVSAAELQTKAAAVSAARSQLNVAKANLKVARVPATNSEIDAAKSAVTDALANLDAAQTALDDYVLKAPADGVVVSVELTEDQSLSSGSPQTPAIIVADVLNPRVDGQLDEVDAASVRAGMPVDVIIDGLGGLSVKGRIDRVSEVAQVDPNGLATFGIEVSLDEHPVGLAAGMAVRMQVITDQAADVLTIPTAAVKRSEGKSVVTVVSETGEAKLRTVQLGKTDGKIVEVVDGLDEGEKVALSAAAGAPK